MSGTSVPEIDATGLRVVVVRSTFNEEVTAGLLEGARAWLERAGAEVEVVEVGGAFELPVVCAHATRRGDAVVAIGAVIRGETDHYEHIAHRTSEGLMRVALDTGTPVAFGVLTAERSDHALARSGAGPANKGAEAAAAAVAAVRAIERLTIPTTVDRPARD